MPACDAGMSLSFSHIKSQIPLRRAEVRGFPAPHFYEETDTSHWAHSAEHLLPSLSLCVCVCERMRRVLDKGAPTFKDLFAEQDGMYCGFTSQFSREMGIGVGTEFGVN